ncbi:MAG: DUF4271 domain-containing protein [Paramuribaculum sp.]|nr:DUF4271 domain-containing protein [Paramuribaculum sp.]
MPAATANHTTAWTLRMPESPSDTVSLCRESQAPAAWSEGMTAKHGVVAWTRGMAPEERVSPAGYDSGVMTLLIAVFLAVTFNFRHYSTFIKTFTQNLFSIRTRANAFDEHNTMRETRVTVSLIMLTCVSEGILMYTYIDRSHLLWSSAFFGIASLSVLSAVYYLWQLAVYHTVGYTFVGPLKSSQWLKGFNASQCLIGIPLIIPALAVIFYPNFSPWLLVAAAILYVMARMIFIFKGFRIFYNKSYTLIYFILYLCALEIIPVILFYKTSLFLTTISSN